MTPEELIKATGQHQLFCGINTYSWNLDQFRQAAQFARAHGVDVLLVKVADGGNIWQSMDGWHSIRNAILAEGVGVIPYAYSYGDKFGAFGTEIEIMLAFLKDCGVFCADLEEEWNGRTDLAQQLTNRIAVENGTFMVSTWADPSLQNWQGVIRALSPCVDVWMPQQYNNYLMTFWHEFAENGAVWLQPTVNLTQDFGPNDPVAIASAAHGRQDTAISVWYYDTAIANPGLLDAVYAAFPKETSMQKYGPGQGDFDTWFSVDSNDNWVAKTTGAAIIGSNLALYQQLSMDGLTLPIIGLPTEGEQYISPRHSTQRFQRGMIVWNPDDPSDRQPGLGESHLLFVDYASIDGFAKAQADLVTLQAKIAELQNQIDNNLVMVKARAALSAVIDLANTVK